MKFNHIGLVVSDIKNYYFNFLLPVIGIKHLTEIVIDPRQKSKIAFAFTENEISIELIEPVGEDSPVAEILKRKRGGLHHLCFTSSSFNEDILRLQQNHCLMISPPEAAVAFNNRRIVFFFTPTFEVIEIVEE